LVVTITEARQVLLNQEDEGTLDDLTRLRTRLNGIFEQRRQNGAFRSFTVLVEKTVVVKASPYLKQEEISKVVGEVWAAGADPINVLSEAVFKVQILDPYDPPPPQPLSAREKERIRRMGPVSAGVMNGKALSLPAPTYPAQARKAKASGMVTVEILVDESGFVTSARAVTGHPLLRTAAVQSARQARFSPTLLSGQPVKVKGVLNYNFTL
jgi:TonB family protein